MSYSIICLNLFYKQKLIITNKNLYDFIGKAVGKPFN